jgi:hypothetical protein
MKRNIIVLLSLVMVQLAIAFALYSIPGRIVDWSSDARLAIGAAAMLGVGAIAYVLSVGKPISRLWWAALAGALPPLVAEAASWSDAAYPGLNYLAAIVMGVVAGVGALVAMLASPRFASRVDRET